VRSFPRLATQLTQNWQAKQPFAYSLRHAGSVAVSSVH